MADYLVSHGGTVFHIMGHDKVESAKLAGGVRARVGGTLVSPPSQPSR